MTFDEFWACTEPSDERTLVYKYGNGTSSEFVMIGTAEPLSDRYRFLFVGEVSLRGGDGGPTQMMVRKYNGVRIDYASIRVVV